MKKLIFTLMSCVLCLGLVGGSFAYFNDYETSTGNTFTAGIVDISVDNENPWVSGSSKFNFTNVKPCEIKEATVTLKNVGDNDVKVWKHIYDVVCAGGVNNFGGASSEPEYVEGGGQFDASGQPTGAGYTERCNLSAYVVYDLYVDDVPIYEESDYVRIGEIACTYIYLGELAPREEMEVKQSYHLMAWPDAAEDQITNWAQGDTMTFSIEFYAEQTTGGAPGPVGGLAPQKTILLENKDPVTWDPITGDGIGGTLTYQTSGTTFDYDLTASGLAGSSSYELIYYAGDPWPGAGSLLIATYVTDASGAISAIGQSAELGMDLVAAKIWLVPAADFNEGAGQMSAWNPGSYLFEGSTVNYDDTDV